MRTVFAILAAAWALAAPLGAARADDAAAPHAGLSGSFVYIYTFLDVREVEFGPRLLDQLDSQLMADLEKGGARAKVLRFKASQPAQAYAFKTQFPVRGSVYSTDPISVDETIQSNLADEAAVGARYRLVEFPVSVSVRGPHEYYAIRYTLIDCATGKTVWQVVNHGKHLIWVKVDEDAEGRARKMTEEVLEQLKTAGYL
ncbi:MAG TPA: hypothetical protein VGL66_12390 [Caulobacteraceae bacterium]|jgi:hypothetical protein